MCWISCMKRAARAIRMAFAARLNTNLARHFIGHKRQQTRGKDQSRTAATSRCHTAKSQAKPAPKAFGTLGTRQILELVYDRSAAAYVRDLSSLVARRCLISLHLSSMRRLFHRLVAGMSTGHFLFPYFINCICFFSDLKY
uniref:Uncharacterized protein n=1 Tax=Ixodes ricinus TaxID=34613 RepID=A0A147BE62_IXORI